MGAQPNPTLARPGLVLGGRYELRALLGSGGMAQVWSATDQHLERVVAVKLLHPHLAADEASVQRFRREALAVAALSHPNVVAVFDTVFADGVEAIVMEYVDGLTLRALLDERHRLERDEVVRLGTSLAGALAHAHANGVVHRDIKPANIMITTEGVPKLTDFGIAKAAAASTDLTMVGTIIGTPTYLAPEQVANEPVDRRADIYSLCVVLYEALAGRPPFTGEDPTAIALARLHRDPVPIGELVDCDPDLAAVLMRGLQRSADRRFQSASDLEAALRSPSTSAAAVDVPPALPLGRASEATTVVHLPEDTVPAASTPRDVPAGETTSLTASDVHPGHVDRRQVDDRFVDDGSASTGELDAPRHRRRRRRRPRRSIVGTLLVGLLLVGPVAVLVALVTTPLTERAAPTTTTDTNPLRPIKAVDAVSFDPLGDGVEHPEEVAHLIDGDPSTTWSTEGYLQRKFGTKTGVGVVIDLGSVHDVAEVQIDTVPDWAGAISLTQTDPSGADVPPDPTRDFAAVDERFGVPFGGVPARFVTIWITQLGPANGGRHGVTIGEVTVVGRPG